MEIQRQAYPRLFALPTTKLDGGRLTESRVSRRARELRHRATRKAARMGLPFAAGRAPMQGANFTLRDRYLKPGPLNDLVRGNIADLAHRGVIDWVDVETLVSSQPVDAEGGYIVSQLMGLEINLKALDRLAARDDVHAARSA